MKERVVLFDGKNLDAFTDQATGERALWKVHDGVVTVTKHNIVSKYEYGDAHIHIEFCLPYMPEMTGQHRANSGVYVQGCYEIQVLDSYGKEIPQKNDCGAVYEISAPLCNACGKPEEWQVYDIYLRSARLGEKGEVKENAVLTVVLNGKVLHNNFSLPSNTPGGVYDHIVAEGPLMLQDHNCPVSFRNIWIQPLD